MVTKNKNLREEAFNLYVLGKKHAAIARALDVTRQTIVTWSKEEKWLDRQKRITEKVKSIQEETLAEVKARQVKIAKAVQGKYIDRLKNDPKLNVEYRDADSAMKHELLLLGESTERTELTGEKAPLTLADLKKAFDNVHKSRLPNRDIPAEGCKDLS